MKFPDYRVGWRLFIARPLGSPLMLLCLSVGFSVCFLLLMFVWYSLNFDSDIPDANRVFLIKDKVNVEPIPAWRDRTPFPVIDSVQESGLIEASVAVVSRPAMPFRVGEQISRVNLLIVQSSFIPVFGVQSVQGNLAETLSHPDRVAITTTTAIKLFGRPDVLGSTVLIYGQAYKIGAILPDRTANTTISYAALAGINSSLLPDRQRDIFFHYWDAFGGRVYLKLKPGVLPESVARVLQDAFDRSPYVAKLNPETLQKLGGRKSMEIGLDRLRSIYFDDGITTTQDNGAPGSWKIVSSIALVALLILFLVVTNYTNFTTMQTINRSREIAIRKVLGITNSTLAMQFMLESVTAVLLATAGGLIITYLLLPIFSDLVGNQLVDLFNFRFLCLVLLLGTVVGVLAGVYPAQVAIRIKSNIALAGRGIDILSGFWMRRALTVIQFSIVITLSSAALVIAWQIEFASHVSQGFDPAHMLVVELPDAGRNSMKNPSARSLRDAISRIPGVVGVATSQKPLGRVAGDGYSEFLRSDGKSATITNRPVSPNFFDVLGVHPIAGRLFSATQDQEFEDMSQATSIVINATAARTLGYTSSQEAVDQLISVDLDSDSGLQKLRIVGIAPDIRQESLHELPPPVAYWPDQYASTLTVKYTGVVSSLEDSVLELAHIYLPNEIINIQPAQSFFDENYEADLRTSKLLGLASIFSIFISAFGIYVLSTYSVQRLAKQIAIRKIYGALYSDIAGVVGKEFFILVLVGAAIGLPIATLINSTYLATFTEQAPVGLWPLVLPVLMVTSIAFLATFQQVLKAIRTNPARILL